MNNHLLASLSSEHRRLLFPHLERVDLPLRFVVEETGRPVEHVYFPATGIISVVAYLDKNHQAEAGTVGWDLCSGHAVILGGGVALTQSYVQVAGHGQRIAAAAFARLLREAPALTAYFRAAAEAFMAQATFTIVTNSRGKLEERLCRWLLMAHDRMEDDVIVITHDLLSVMLGVRRPGVTTALQYLEDRQAVKTQRGRITVLDRAFLEKCARPFYGAAEAAHARLTGWRTQKTSKALLSVP
jgi:hypothetical protein